MCFTGGLSGLKDSVLGLHYQQECQRSKVVKGALTVLCKRIDNAKQAAMYTL